MRTLAFPLAVLLVALVPPVLVGVGVAIARWGRWVVRAGGAVGIAGLVVTGACFVNLLVPRTCDRVAMPGGALEEVNRPLLSLAVGRGDCFRAAVGQAQLVALAGVATSAAALVVRRSAPDAVGAAPDVPSR